MRRAIGTWLIQCGLRVALGKRGKYTRVVINGEEVQ